MKLKKLLYIAPLLVLLLSLFCVEASAVEEVTLTTLDPDTGEPIPENGDEEVANLENSDRVILSSTMTYERSTDSFLISSGGVAVDDIRTNVPNGIMTRDPVSITIPAGTTAILYRDGVEVTEETLDNITQPGSYVLDLSGSLSRSVQPFKFTIIRENINSPDIYRVPDGFSVDYVLLNGENQFSSSIMAEFSQDGVYNIRYSCEQAGKSFSLNFTKDTVAPEMYFEGLKPNMTARGPVGISLSEGDIIYVVTIDGKSAELTTPFTERGDYSIAITDLAGNMNSYRFTIKFYFNSNGVFFILLFAVIAAGLGIYLLRARKKLRVR